MDYKPFTLGLLIGGGIGCVVMGISLLPASNVKNTVDKETKYVHIPTPIPQASVTNYKFSISDQGEVAFDIVKDNGFATQLKSKNWDQQLETFIEQRNKVVNQKDTQ